MNRFAFILASAAVLAACEPTEPATADVLGLYIVPPPAGMPEGFDAATFRDDVGEILGVEIVASEASRGSFTLFLDDCTGPKGEAAGGDACYRMSRSCWHPESAAHEIGHLSGLEHVADRGNLMHGSAVGGPNYLTTEQIATMRAELGRALACDPMWARIYPGAL